MMLRREVLTRLGLLGATACLPRAAWPGVAWTGITGSGVMGSGITRPVRLAAAWQQGDAHQVGVLQVTQTQVTQTQATQSPAGQGALTVAAAIDVPTRAHALLALANGDLLAVARRPGNWLLRWTSQGQARTWGWIEPGRVFTGHAVQRGNRLFIAETDLESGAGLIGVRDAGTLEKLAEWPTHGIDPHQILFDAEGHLVVANGGVPTRPESGRAKVDLARMDSSLVRLDGKTGVLLGQWRLPDTRLSLRHLAWHGEHLGIALQAEHDDPGEKAAAPVLAVFDGKALKIWKTDHDLGGYAGSIAAVATGFALSCPRRNLLAFFDFQGSSHTLPLAEACALDAIDGALWAGGRDASRVIGAKTGSLTLAQAGFRLDNHWLLLG